MNPAVQHNVRYWRDPIAEEAVRLGVEEAAMQAISAVECGEVRYPDVGWPVIRFEVHICQDKCPADLRSELDKVIRLVNVPPLVRWDNGAHQYKSDPGDPWEIVHSGSQGDEYAAMVQASSVVGDIAAESASYGIGQLMGYHWPLLGCSGVREMVGDAVGGGVPKQIEQWGLYIERAKDGRMLAALRARNWYDFAYLYNGSGRPGDYAVWLENAYDNALDALANGVPDDHDLTTYMARQTALVRLGYDLGSFGVDGDWGPASTRALKAFQGDHNLNSDGLWGRKTEVAMNDALDALDGS